jgi:hypothetical protein
MDPQADSSLNGPMRPDAELDEAVRQHTPDVARTQSHPWSVEHYGFDAGPDAPRTVHGDENNASSARDRPSSRAHAVAPAAVRRPRRTRVLLASVALALGLTAGGAGFAVAQASGPGSDHTVAHPFPGDVSGTAADGPGPGRGGHR